MKKRISLSILCMLFYVASLFFISSKQNVYDVELEINQSNYVINRVENGAYCNIPLVISNHSNRTVSTQLNINLSYHLYKVVEGQHELVSIENIRSTVSNIYPKEVKEVNMQIEVPTESGTYIVYADLIEENVTWYSEHGMLTAYTILEVY